MTQTDHRLYTQICLGRQMTDHWVFAITDRTPLDKINQETAKRNLSYFFANGWSALVYESRLLENYNHDEHSL